MRSINAVFGCLVTVLLGTSLEAYAQTPAPKPDPFAYLIPAAGTKALAWSKQQTEATRAELEASPTFRSVLADMETALSKQATLPTYYLVGRRYIRFEQNKSHPYGRIEVTDVGAGGQPQGAWRIVFDLDAYNTTAAHPSTIKSLNPDQECLARTYSRCMIPLWYEGGQQNAYIELDLDTGQVVKDGFRLKPGRNFVSWIDPNTLLVAHTTDGARAMPNQYPAALQIWKRGTSLSQAPKIFELSPDQSWFGFNVVGPSDDRRIFLNVVKTYKSFQLKELTLDGRTVDLPLPLQLKHYGKPVFMRGKLAVQLAAPAVLHGKSYPADSVLAYDFASRKVSLVMTPPAGVYLSGDYSGLEQGFAVVGVRNLQRILYLATPKGNGWRVKQQLMEPPGVTLNLASNDLSDGLLLCEQGLLVPPQARWLGSGPAVLIDSGEPEADLRGYTVDIRSARGADGVSIDYYLMHKKGPQAGPTPTILQGYGGFGYSDEPNYFCCGFGASWRSWFNRGGAFVIAAVRGGGERGGEWHLAGAGLSKKKMFDDFATVAENLERSGFTDAKHLGITGHSNGGLLTAGAVVLRPDLYGAAVIVAPLTDFSIVGHGDGGIGASMNAEFGNWSDPAQRRIMQTWDPYSNIKMNVTYPPVLVVVASNDTQVGPSHARRYVAKLQSVGAPALLLEGSSGGHDYPNEYTQTSDVAMMMTFFIDNLMKP